MEDGVRDAYLQDCVETFRKYKAMADSALERLSDQEFFASLDAESNSPAVLVKHMAGNLRSRWTDLFTSDGEKPDRNRDDEFVISDSDLRSTLMAAWEDGWGRAFRTLEGLTHADRERTVRIRGEPHSLPQALNRQMTHAAYHVGQLVLLAKHYRAADWESLSIPRGRSQEFNAGVSHPR